MGRPYSARNCTVKFRDDAGVTVTLLAARATVHTNADRIDVTNFNSTSVADGRFFGDYIGGVTSATVNIESYDSDRVGAALDNFWDASFRAGINSGQLCIYLDKPVVVGATNSWYFPSLTVIDCSSEMEAHGAVKTMIQVMNRGIFYGPGELKPVGMF